MDHEQYRSALVLATFIAWVFGAGTGFIFTMVCWGK